MPTKFFVEVGRYSLKNRSPFGVAVTEAWNSKRVGGEVTVSGICLAGIKPGHHNRPDSLYMVCVPSSFIVYLSILHVVLRSLLHSKKRDDVDFFLSSICVVIKIIPV